MTNSQPGKRGKPKRRLARPKKAFRAGKPSNSGLRLSLQGSLSFYRVIFEELNEAVVILNRRGMITFCNAKFTELTGRVLNEILGLGFSELLPESERQAFAALLQAEQGLGLKAESSLNGPQGILAVSLALKSLRLADELYYTLILSDLSEFKAHQLAMQRALAQAQEAIRAKSEFLANVSHEIRTPLNAMLGVLQLFRQDPASRKDESLIESARQSGQGLLRIIDNILEMSKLEAGILGCDESDFDPSALAYEVVAMFAPLAVEKGLTLKLEIDPGVPELVRADAPKLRQILVNLLGNALKFTPEGEAALSLRHDASAGTLNFTVIDNGIGLPQDILRLLREPFRQADSSMTRSHSGLGLGLCVVKRLSKLMRAEFEIGNLPERGTLARISLKQSSHQRPASIIPAAGHLSCPQQKVILLVEDDAVCRYDGQAQLEKCGFRVICACDGLEGLRILAEQEVDAVIMDLHMPRMDGFETALAMRDAARFGKKASLPIISLTAYAEEDTRRQCLAAGMDEALAKPLRLEPLLHVLRRYF